MLQPALPGFDLPPMVLCAWCVHVEKVAPECRGGAYKCCKLSEWRAAFKLRYCEHWEARATPVGVHKIRLCDVRRR